jgi:hypothetical protein
MKAFYNKCASTHISLGGLTPVEFAAQRDSPKREETTNQEYKTKHKRTSVQGIGLVSRRWGKVTGCKAGGGFRGLVRARHAVPLCGEGVWVGDVALEAR